MLTSDQARQLAFSPTLDALADTARMSRIIIAELTALPWWRPMRAELWNQYVYLRALHKPIANTGARNHDARPPGLGETRRLVPRRNFAVSG